VLRRPPPELRRPSSARVCATSPLDLMSLTSVWSSLYLSQFI
jgi:hypothetical protein